MARVLLQKVTKRYGGGAAPAVDDVSIEAADGEFLVLVGPSGCGKTTTLRLIAGLEDADAGDITIGDRRVNDVEPQHRDIAMIFQNYALYPHMTVYQNLGFGLKMRRTPKAEIDQRVREVAESLGLTEYLNRKPRALSGGQRQRVALGRAIVRRPQVFLFDEPLSNLDAKMRVTMRGEIRGLHRRLGTTMVYVTHDQVEAMTMGDRIAVMHEGRVQQHDAPEALYRRPVNRFVAGFIGSPAMNILDGKITGKAGKLVFESNGFRVPVPEAAGFILDGQKLDHIAMGIRPEDISLAAESDGAHLMPFSARIENREPLGAEEIVYLKVEGQSLVARLTGDPAGKVGDRRTFCFDPRKAHFFHPTSGERID